MGPPTNLLPEQWKLRHFYAPGTFPLEILQPMLFNGRLMSKLFLPEQLREDAMGTGPAPSDLPAPAGAPLPAVEGDEPPNETGDTTRPPSAKGLSSAEPA